MTTIDGCLWTAGLPSPSIVPAELPDSTDVAIIGGGYTGLSAARALGVAGTDVTLLERERLGAGASSRNGGFVLPGFKPDLAEIAARHGNDTARSMFAMSVDAVNLVEQLIRSESIDCAFARPGNIALAARPAHLPLLRESARLLKSLCDYDSEILDAHQLPEELGSATYFGGQLEPTAAALQPALYLAGLAASTRRSGVRLIEQTGVTGISGRRGHFVLTTSRGPIRAREVIVATDGFTGPWSGPVRRRVVAVGSYMVATVPLDPELQRQLIPKRRVMSDTKRLLNYFRLSPDGRMVFGGRAGFVPGRLAGSRELLITQMRRVFPQLMSTPVEFAWGGHLGFTWDQLPHVGVREGIHYAVGYCGHGVALSTWLGTRIGETLAGTGTLPEIPEAGFRAIPAAGLIDWLLPLVGLYYRIRDALD